MAFNFSSASSQYLEAGSVVATAIPITMACWFYTTDNTVNQALISIARASSNIDYFQLGIWGNIAGDPVVANARSVGGNGIAQGASSFSINTWQHACAVFEGTTVRRVYFQGAVDGTNTTSATPNTATRMAIGRLARATATDYMSGAIAEPGIWDVVLSAAEITALAKGVSPLKIRPQSLKVYHPLIRENVATIGPAFTAYNSPTVAAHPRIFY